MKFGDKVRRLMKARGLKQKGVAESLGTQQPMVSDWVRHHAPPTDRGRLLDLARLLGVTVDYLIDDRMEKPDEKDLTLDERTILDVIKALGLPRDEVIRRLYGPARTAPGSADDPNQGQARLLAGGQNQHDAPNAR